MWAKLAAPGMCNPNDDTPTVDGPPAQQAIDKDARGQAQRQHDALKAALRALLASGKLGQHNGLPASIIVTTTLTELEAAAGRGLTGGGTILPMSDVIRLARHARHYLAIFDKGKALALYHTKRLASPASGSCSTPRTVGVPPRVHRARLLQRSAHVTDYAKCRCTDVNDLTFGCGTQHRIVQPGGWSTRKNAKGETEWIPPPHHLDRGQTRTNTYWHPEKLLRHSDEDGDDDDGDNDDEPA